MDFRQYGCYGCPHLQGTYCTKREKSIYDNPENCSYYKKELSYMDATIYYGYPHDDKYNVWYFGEFKGFDTVEEAKKFIEETKDEIDRDYDEWFAKQRVPKFGQTGGRRKKHTEE